MRERLDRRTIEFLLSAVEAPELRISAAALRAVSEQVAAELLAAGFVQAEGYEAASMLGSDHWDVPVPLAWSEETGAFGYFSPAVGWTRVAHDEVRSYKIQLHRVLVSLVHAVPAPSNARPAPLIDDSLWDVGKFRLGRRTHLTSLMFGRRLHDPATWRKIRELLRTRLSAHTGLVLTTTNSEVLPDAPANTLICPIADVLCGEFGLEADILASRLDGFPVATREGLVVSADGKEVRFRGETHRFSKGEQQRRIIRFLYERHLAGEDRVSVSTVIDKLDLRDNARIRDFFKKHPTWNRLIVERDGTCGFRFE